MYLFEKRVTEIIVGDFIEGFGEVVEIRKSGVRTQFQFEDKFKSFMNSMTVYCCKRDFEECNNEIRLCKESLKEGMVIAKCGCGGKIECIYEGEVFETYNYFCECGASLTIDGYSIDAAMDALMDA